MQTAPSSWSLMKSVMKPAASSGARRPFITQLCLGPEGSRMVDMFVGARTVTRAALQPGLELIRNSQKDAQHAYVVPNGLIGNG